MASLPTNRDEAEAFVRNFHEICDELDVETLDRIYTKDVVFQFSNYPIIHGLDAVKSQLGAQFIHLDKMHHGLRYADVSGDRVYQATIITYVVKGDIEDDQIEIPAAAIHHLETEGPEKGKTKRFEVFLNNTPLVERIVELASK